MNGTPRASARASISARPGRISTFDSATASAISAIVIGCSASSVCALWYHSCMIGSFSAMVSAGSSSIGW